MKLSSVTVWVLDVLLVAGAAAPTDSSPQTTAVPQGTQTTEAAPPASQQTPVERAWTMLHAGVQEKNFDRRSVAVRALGLIRNNQQAIELAEHALGDDKPQVRTAAARAMEQMKCLECVSRLKDALEDKDGGVALAAAHALWSMKDSTAYDVYFAVLTGKRKTQEGLVAQGMDTLRDKKKMAQFGLEEGIGFIPFAGMGYSAAKALTKDDVSPVRAAAAAILANDPDPQTADALVKASSDKSWVVRAAALDAIGKRDDPKLSAAIVPALSDAKDVVRDTAAATLIRLDDDARAVATSKPNPGSGKIKRESKHRKN